MAGTAMVGVVAADGPAAGIAPAGAPSGRAHGDPGAPAPIGSVVGDGFNGSGFDGRSGSMVTVCSLSLVAKCADGVETSRLARRPHAEHDADGEAEEDGGDDGPRVEHEAPAGQLADPGR